MVSEPDPQSRMLLLAKQVETMRKAKEGIGRYDDWLRGPAEVWAQTKSEMAHAREMLIVQEERQRL